MKAKKRDKREATENESKVSPEKISLLKKSALAAILVIFVFVAFSATASAAIINVPDDYATIQQAINNVTAENRTIEVDATAYAGTTETVIVNKSDIIIRSVNGRAKVTAGGASDHVFNITDQRNVTLKGFEIRDARGTTQSVAGIDMYNASECNISNNVVTNITATGNNYSYGIWLRYSDDNKFSSSTNVSYINATNRARGIGLQYSDNNTFSSSTTVSNVNTNYHAHGIYLRDSDNNTFRSSTTVSYINANYAYGIWLSSSDDNTFNSSTTVSNVNAGIFGIGIWVQGYSNNNKFSSSTNVSYINATDVSAYGIRVSDNSDDNTFNSSTSISNLNANRDAYGIALEHGSGDNKFYDCTISDLTAGAPPTTYGIYIVSLSDNNIISRAKISRGAGPRIDYGVYMQGCSDDFILDSNVSDCEYGIYIDDKSAHTMSGNTIYDNDFGIYLYDTWDNIITENEISDNGDGVWVEHSYNNTIERNMIVNNKGGDGTGVHITDGSDENEIHGNCFIDNEPYQAVDDCVGDSNHWNGNYWSPPPGEPGDPYLIPGDAGSRDTDPLPYCPGKKPPAKVPALTPIGIIALVGLLSVVLALSIRRKK